MFNYFNMPNYTQCWDYLNPHLFSNTTSTISKVSSDSVMQLFNRMLQKNFGISKEI